MFHIPSGHKLKEIKILYIVKRIIQVSSILVETRLLLFKNVIVPGQK